MSKNALAVVLEVEKESANHENEMFYRYRIGDFKLWFSQADNGNIYSVGFVEDGDELKDFDLHVYADEYGRGGYYPNVFEIRLRSCAMTTSEVRDYMVKAEKACAVLDTVENFFKTSKHFELYAKFHHMGEKSIRVEAFPAQGGAAVYGQVYPVRSQADALAMFREEHPEYKGCILVAENVYEKSLAGILEDATLRAGEASDKDAREAEKELC